LVCCPKGGKTVASRRLIVVCVISLVVCALLIVGIANGGSFDFLRLAWEQVEAALILAAKSG